MTYNPQAGQRGGARKEFIAAVSKAIDEIEQGKGATACMADIKASYYKMKERLK